MARSLCSCAHKSISLSVTLLLKRETRDNNAFLIYCSLKRETQRSCTSGGNVTVDLLLRSPYTEADDQRYRLGWRKKKKFLQNATVKTQFLITNLWPSVKFKSDRQVAKSFCYQNGAHFQKKKAPTDLQWLFYCRFYLLDGEYNLFPPTGRGKNIWKLLSKWHQKILLLVVQK